MTGHEYIWVPELGGQYRVPQGIKQTPELIAKHGERIGMPGEDPAPSAGKCFTLLGLLRQEVNRLYENDQDGARQVMNEVSTFETDWWGIRG